MNCSRCGHKISEGEQYSYQGKEVCDDCYMKLGMQKKGCNPWSTYTATHTKEQDKPKSTER